MSVMSYARVLDATAKRLGHEADRETVNKVCAAFIETILQNAIDGKTVQIENFGSFRLKFLNRRSIPQHYMSGEEAMSEAHFKLTFKEHMAVKRRMVKTYREYLDLEDPDAEKEDPYAAYYS